ncbi:MAG: DnaJ domain-containing protein [Oscillospiraceae bacterium]|jgi:molecular chaperone DnaJ|nr:DnaJ domain-containing protein [Oscillospiraceae bacterium]
MKDPYEILCISNNASFEEIKKAYRKLAKKYHPDNYQDNPLADLAAEKMREINEAYYALTGGKSKNSSSNSAGGYRNVKSDFINVRTLIANNRLNEADGLLSEVSEASRNAEWYFLKGVIFCKRGWIDEGYNCISKACQIDPSNREYAEMYNRISSQRNGNFGPYGYDPMGNSGNIGGCNCADICLTLACFDCCCRT